VSSGEEAVDLNQDFEGRGAGGGEETTDVREMWRVAKSEYRFWTTKVRRGRRRVMLYRVNGFSFWLLERMVEGIEISRGGAIVLVALIVIPMRVCVEVLRIWFTTVVKYKQR
jgi:hypothetical protein